MTADAVGVIGRPRVGWRLPENEAFPVVRWGLSRHLTTGNASGLANPLPTARPTASEIGG